MKKILSLALVLAMVLTMSVTAFAADNTLDNERKTGTTEVTHTVSDSYIVTIPDSMSVGTDATVSVSDVTLAKDYKLAVYVSSTQYNDGWKLKNGDDTIGYTLKIDNTDVANNGTVLTVKSGEIASKTLNTVLTGTAKYSGNYTDTLTFSVTLKEHYSYDATTASADELKTALTTALQAGKTDIEITLPANADSTMFTAIRRALIDTEGVADGSINLTLKGVTTIPDHDEYVGGSSIFGSVRSYKNGNPLDDPECVTQLKSVNLPDVLTIGEDAFSACTNLEAVNLPDVLTIGEDAFSACTNLEAVNLPKVVTIKTHAFNRCDIRTLDLPEVKTIGGSAFENNANLVSCSAPKATTIDFYPWGDCSKLETLELTAAGDLTLYNNLFANTPTGQINLVLNKDKQSQVSGNTWTTRNDNGDEVSFTFKSITFVD